jgi:hypothetical protein
MSDGLAGLRGLLAKMTPMPWEVVKFLGNRMAIRGKYGWVCAVMMTTDLDEDCPEQASKNGPGIVALVNAAPALLDAAAWVRANGKHAEGCRALTSETWWFGKTYPPCTCGLDAVLAGLESLEGKTRE